MKKRLIGFWDGKIDHSFSNFKDPTGFDGYIRGLGFNSTDELDAFEGL